MSWSFEKRGCMNVKPFLLSLAIIAAVLISGCAANGNDDTLIVKIGDAIPQDVCNARGMSDSVIVLHQTGCPACTRVLPILAELESETGMEFEYYNLAVDVDFAELEEKYDLLPTHTPTVIIGCVAHGSMDKEGYRNLIEG